MFWAFVELAEWFFTGRIGFFLVFFIFCTILFGIKYYYYRKYRIPQGTYDKPVSIIAAVYKEKPWLFEKCLTTIKDQNRYNDELIVIFDGKNDELEDIARKYTDKIHVLDHDGKRNALAYGIMKASHDIIVTVDSDTYFDNDCITKIVEPFSDENIGAVSSNQRIFEPERSLVRTFANLFEIASHDFNQLGESARGHVGCLFGRCVAFRKGLLLPYLEHYKNEMFLDVKCAGSDDRLLTDIVIMQGYKTVIRKDAMCYTDCPDTWSGYIKQQRRWQNGSQRSTVSRFPWLLKGSKVTAFSFLLHIIIPFWAILVWANWAYMAIYAVKVWLMLSVQTHIIIGTVGAILTWTQRNYYIFGHTKYINILLWLIWMGIIMIVISSYSFIEIFIRRDSASQWRTK